MSHIFGKRHLTATLLPLLLASLVLAACGSSSKNSTSSTSTNAAATGTTNGAPNASTARAGRISAFRECMQKNGVTPPKPGSAGTFGGLLYGRGRPLPKGVSRAQYEAALKKCASSLPHRAPFSRQAGRQMFVQFAACMRQNGINLPTPKTGKGPVFDTKGINTTSPQFRAAFVKCRTALRSVLGLGRPGTGG
jgi:hypothetical protein